jgi:FkbM family methyltransferase
VDNQQIRITGGPTRNGYMLWLPSDTYVGQSLTRYGEFSASEWQVFGQFVDEKSMVIEVGAHIGAHTVPFAKAAFGVEAFEPQEWLCRLLKANLAINGCKNVGVNQMALGAKKEEAFFPNLNYNMENNYGSVFVKDWRTEVGEEKCFPVMIYALDNFLIGNCPPTFMKIDAEGSEADVLRGANRVIKQHRPVIYVENDRPENSADLLNQLVLELGYRAWWHVALLYNASNFLHNPENIFSSQASFNLICLPEESPWTIRGIPCLPESPKPPMDVPIGIEYFNPIKVTR